MGTVKRSPTTMLFTRLAAVFILFRLSSCQVRRETGRGSNEEYPHQVLIVVTGENHDVYNPCRGSGTLISDQWVLTAAHNFDNDEDTGKAVSAEVSVPAMGYSAEAASWYPHPTYNFDHDLEGDEYDFDMVDIALVRLKTPFMDGNKPAEINAAGLPQPDEEIENFSDVRFAGYGENDHGDEPVLYEGKSVKLPIYYCWMKNDLDDKEAHNMDAAVEKFEYFENELDDQGKKNLKEFHELVYHSHICTGVRRPREIGPYIGYGDSGCGLFKPEGSTVYGVLSTSDYENTHDQQFTRPALWVKVSKCLDFIRGTMNRHSDKEFGRQKGSLNFAFVLTAMVCAYFL